MLLVLGRLGVPATSLVASAAVIGAAVGFAAQQVVRDLIAGFFIISRPGRMCCRPTSCCAGGAEAFEDEDLRPLLLKEPTVMGAESLELHGRLRTSTATPGPETTTTPTRAPTTSAARTTTTDRFSR